MIARLLSTAAVCVAFSGQAFADGEIIKIITKADSARLERYESARDTALSEARGNGSPEAVATLEDILSRPKLSFDGFDMTGDWQCRTIKAGDLVPVVIYDWFRCRVADHGAGWELVKLSGSQRTAGRFFDDGEDRLIYLGTYFVAGAQPPSYGTNPAADQVGYVFRSGDEHWRIEFPWPARESRLDILEFRRRN